MTPTAAAESPQPPAAAYGEMVELLGPRYFRMKVPAAGVLVRVAGVDGIVTEWAIPYEYIAQVRDAVNRNPALRFLASLPCLEKDVRP